MCLVCFHFFHLFLLSWKFLTPQDSNFSRNMKASLENSSTKKIKEAKKVNLRMKKSSKKALQEVIPNGANLQQFAQSKWHYLFQCFSLNLIVSMLTLQHKSHSLLFCQYFGISRPCFWVSPTLQEGLCPEQGSWRALWGSGELCPIHCRLSEVGTIFLFCKKLFLKATQ